MRRHRIKPSSYNYCTLTAWQHTADVSGVNGIAADLVAFPPQTSLLSDLDHPDEHGTRGFCISDGVFEANLGNLTAVPKVHPFRVDTGHR